MCAARRERSSRPAFCGGLVWLSVAAYRRRRSWPGGLALMLPTLLKITGFSGLQRQWRVSAGGGDGEVHPPETAALVSSSSASIPRWWARASVQDPEATSPRSTPRGMPAHLDNSNCATRDRMSGTDPAVTEYRACKDAPPIWGHGATPGALRRRAAGRGAGGRQAMRWSAQICCRRDRADRPDRVCPCRRRARPAAPRWCGAADARCVPGVGLSGEAVAKPIACHYAGTRALPLIGHLRPRRRWSG